ncbi:MAG: hypothetical protein U9R28_08425, partial [Pseudomonadota bacterium]|nr:hypothetical protein [Pseudomonadota bacterium]
MPGTHSDNDHSFIEVLPFEYKKVAHLILRSSSLEQMLEDLKNHDSQHFLVLKGKENLTTLEIDRTICAAIVAKITSLSKGLFVSDLQFNFIEELLYKALSILLDIQSSDLSTIHAHLKYEHSKTLEWILKDNAKDEVPTLEIRRRRDNNRRYFRYKADMRYHFVRVGSHEKVAELQGDIYSSGIKHFNDVMNAKLDKIVARYTHNIGLALQTSFPEAHTLFMVVLDKLEQLRTVLNGVSVGVLDLSSAMNLLTVNLQTSLDYESLNGNIRTEQILRDFEEKLNQLNQNTLKLLEKSTPHKLYEGPVLAKLKIDHDIRGYMEKNKNNASKLLHAFIDLYHYTLLMEKIYNNISSSNYIIVFPEYWTDDFHDISPGGVAFYTEFLVDQNDILELYFRVNISTSDEEQFEIIHQKAKVVRVEEKPELEKYLIACEFIICPE